ncbi:MAG: hypothetical protein ACM3UP_00815 [Methanocella sp.]
MRKRKELPPVRGIDAGVPPLPVLLDGLEIMRHIVLEYRARKAAAGGSKDHRDPIDPQET